jgi:hypothetical protein
MKAISVQQPWAWAILFAGKDVENRSWRTNHRGPILIHAGKKIDKDGVKWLKEQGIEVPGDLPTGCYVGKVDIIGCREIKVLEWDNSQRNKWASGPYCWILDQPRAFNEPVPARGQLGIFRAPLEAAMQMEADG